MKSFIKEVAARITGDNAEATAQKNYRKATSAIDVQVHTLKAKLVDQEAAVETATENLENAQFPTSLITDNSYYVSNIKSQYDNLEAKKEALEATKNSIAFFEGLLVKFDAEV